jgi:hypothetical protein
LIVLEIECLQVPSTISSDSSNVTAFCHFTGFHRPDRRLANEEAAHGLVVRFAVAPLDRWYPIISKAKQKDPFSLSLPHLNASNVPKVVDMSAVYSGFSETCASATEINVDSIFQFHFSVHANRGLMSF